MSGCVAPRTEGEAGEREGQQTLGRRMLPPCIGNKIFHSSRTQINWIDPLIWDTLRCNHTCGESNMLLP